MSGLNPVWALCRPQTTTHNTVNLKALNPSPRHPSPPQKKIANQAALPAIQKLLASADVLGVSCYARTSAYPKPKELESCAVKYDAELKVGGR
jgi:hypothetical protein